ncbi:unnamed protein product [Zymoseptoria tritici ST99CH_3D7]|uniref:Uncharacterized protein n=1 Tax=Zymoseptoria tritici (strain ST99CH_3D7) TaxID=1276538 RepID=A0A1X7RR23_ZYMT9|nr:unnamed protein product [Zymoseptoria tritici ST99CH_3D7]
MDSPFNAMNVNHAQGKIFHPWTEHLIDASPAESHQYLPYRALDPAWTGDDRDDNLGSHVCTTRAQHVVC